MSGHKNNYLMVRLSPEDREAIRQEAERRGSYVSTVAREMIREGIRRIGRVK